MDKTKVLIAVDEPQWAKVITKTACEIIDMANSEITLINVLETTTAKENLFYVQPQKFIEHEAKKSEFAEIENFLENSDVEYKGFMYEEGQASGIIIDIIAKRKYDLVVIGTHNKKALERFFLGSVTHKITRYAKCSVLIINQKNQTELSSNQPFSALMGVDISQDTVYMSENLWKFIDRNRAKISLLHVTMPPSIVIPPDAYIYMNMEEIIKEANFVAQEILDKSAKILAQNGIMIVNKYQKQGDAASIILDEAASQNHDLIIVGSHSGYDISRWLLGSVSSKIYENAKQSVMIIKSV